MKQILCLEVKSAAFQEGGMIPPLYTCDGKNISPPLSWGEVPRETKSIALIADDPDAPKGTWVHWVLYNLPPTVKELPQGIPPDETMNNGAKQGITDFHRTGYGGPCPPNGIHRYFFKLYALNTVLPLKNNITKAELEQAMYGHILTEGQLMGRYTRP